MKTKERQENAVETRSVTRGDLTEVGRLTRAKKKFFVWCCQSVEKSTFENKNIKNIDNCQKGNPRALQVTAHLGQAVQSKLMLEICCVLEMFLDCVFRFILVF